MAGVLIEEKSAKKMAQVVKRFSGERHDRRRTVKQRGVSRGKGRTLEYTGYFTAINTSSTENETTTNKITIIDGNNPDNTICGRVIVGNQTIDVNKQEFTVSGSGSIVIKIDYEYIGESDTPTYSAILEDVATIPTTEGILYYEICNYLIIDDRITISQVFDDGELRVSLGYWV